MKPPRKYQKVSNKERIIKIGSPSRKLRGTKHLKKCEGIDNLLIFLSQLKVTLIMIIFR